MAVRVTEEDINDLTNKIFKWIFEKSLKPAVKILKHNNKEINEENLNRLVNEIFEEHLKKLKKIANN